VSPLTLPPRGGRAGSGGAGGATRGVPLWPACPYRRLLWAAPRYQHRMFPL